jgi:hypothetical protein
VAKQGGGRVATMEPAAQRMTHCRCMLLHEVVVVEERVTRCFVCASSVGQ